MNAAYPHPCGHRNHLGFEVQAGPGDDLFTPATPSTVVDLNGQYDTVIAAVMAFQAAGYVFVDVLQAHPCSVLHGCVHAAVVLDGHISTDALTAVLVAEFGPPTAMLRDPASNPTVLGPPADPRLN